MISIGYSVSRRTPGGAYTNTVFTIELPNSLPKPIVRYKMEMRDMYSNTIHIEVEDLHAGTVERAKSRFVNYKEAVEYSLKLNDYYAKNAIPRIATVKD